MKTTPSFLTAFNRLFRENYEYLYDHDLNGEKTDYYCTIYDKFLSPLLTDFITAFVEFRKDFISSDREARAFAMATEVTLDIKKMYTK